MRTGEKSQGNEDSTPTRTVYGNLFLTEATLHEIAVYYVAVFEFEISFTQKLHTNFHFLS